jgi:hypothetical protein
VYFVNCGSTGTPSVFFTHQEVLCPLPQNDFHAGGTLGVPGALEDSSRIADMIRKHSRDIDEIYVTMDSHHVSGVRFVLDVTPLDNFFYSERILHMVSSGLIRLDSTLVHLHLSRLKMCSLANGRLSTLNTRITV